MKEIIKDAIRHFKNVKIPTIDKILLTALGLFLLILLFMSIIRITTPPPQPQTGGLAKVPPNQKRLFYFDEGNNHCYEILNDTLLQLRCVCSCEQFKANGKKRGLGVKNGQ